MKSSTKSSTGEFDSIYKIMEDPKVKEELEKHEEESKEINRKQNEEILKSKNDIKIFYDFFEGKDKNTK